MDNDKEVINIDLKNKITERFSLLSPNDTQKFINVMNRVDKLIGGSSEANSNSLDFSDISLDEQEIEDIEKLKQSNELFKEQEMNKFQYQIVENFALPEALVTYRDDEIITELIDYFKTEKKSTTFSNEDKLEMWVNELMALVKQSSIIETDKIDETKQYIKGPKEYDENYKPIIEQFNQGKGTGVDWITPIAKEKKKIYGAGDLETDYNYSVEYEDEMRDLKKIYDAKSNQGVLKDRFINFDLQQKKIHELDKVSKIPDDVIYEFTTRHQDCLLQAEEKLRKNTEDLDLETLSSDILLDKTKDIEKQYEEDIKKCNIMFEQNPLETNKEIYYYDADNYILGKRVLDKGLIRPENIYKTKDTERQTKGTEKRKTIGTKKLIGQRDITVIEPEKVYVDGFVLNPPGFKDKHQLGSLYQKTHKNVYENNKEILSETIPFRDLDEQYVIFKYKKPTSDYLGLKKETNELILNKRNVPLSTLKENDKVIVSLSYPHIFDNSSTTEKILPVSVRPEAIDLSNFETPNKIQILAQVASIDDLDKSTRRLSITPMISGFDYMTDFWLDKSIVLENPKIEYKFACNCDELKENDNAIILLNELIIAKYVNKNNIETKPRKNKYLVGVLNKKETVFDNQKLIDVVDIVITRKLENTIEFIIREGSYSNNKVIMNISDFKDIYISKSLYSKGLLINSIKSLLQKPSIKKVEYLDKDYSDGIPVWGKVLGTYNEPKVLKNGRIRGLVHLVQSLSPSNKPVGSFFLIEDKDIEYMINKTVFERYLLGSDTSIFKWFEGIFLLEDINDFVPTIQEFLNKITKILRNRDNISYNFLDILLNLSLLYDKKQIHSVVKERLNYWIEWNIINHVEKRAFELEKIRGDYIDLMRDFLEGDVLNPNKFRLIRDISLSLLNYNDWNVKLTDFDWSTVKNKKIAEDTAKEHSTSKRRWNRLNKNDLSRVQKKLIESEMTKEVQLGKIYNPYERMKSLGEELTREQKIIRSILNISDPVLKSNALINFISNNCYLGEDIKSGTLWYYSKIDTKKTKLLCPHIYDSARGMDLSKYEFSEDGLTICNNCGQVLDTITFSYFQGYGDEANSRGNVIEIDGLERVGTIEDIDILVSLDELGQKEIPAIQIVETVFNSDRNPSEYLLEIATNDYLNLLPKVRLFLGSNTELKVELINDIQQYLLNSDTNNYEDWKKKALIRYDKLIAANIDKDKKARQAKLPKGKKLEYPKEAELKVVNTILQSIYKVETESERLQAIIARLSILVEKQIPQNISSTLDRQGVIQMLSQSKIEQFKGMKLNDFIAKVNIIYYVFKERFSNISELYTIAARKDTEVKFGEEEKYEEFTDRNINDELNLYDALEWLKFNMRKVHKGELIVPKEQEIIECGLVQEETYTSKDRLELTQKIQEAINDIQTQQDMHKKYTGVKSRKQFYSSIEFTLPEVSENISEANFIGKNLYLNPTKEQILEIQVELDKYKMIDYLIVYKLDGENIIPRLYENGVDDETGSSREQLINYYKELSNIQLKEIYDSLKSKSIRQEVSKDIAIQENVGVDINKLNNIYEKLMFNITTILGVKDKATASLLKNIGREYRVLPNGEVIFEVNNIKSTDPKEVQRIKKEILIKEFENITKVFHTFKRDYNYIANNYDISLRLINLMKALGKNVEELEDSGIQTEYNYLIEYTNIENKDNREGLVNIKNEFELIEEITEGNVRNIIEFLELRNKMNTMVIYMMMLKVLTQSKFNSMLSSNDDFLRDLDILEFTDEDSNNPQNVFLSRFLIDFIKNMSDLLSRNNEVLKDIKTYKQVVFDLQKQFLVQKTGKDISLIGKDLAFEFNKVMKGKRKLGVSVEELASDAPLESATQPRLDRYSAEPEDQYTTIQTNAIEGENEEGDNEIERMDQTD